MDFISEFKKFIDRGNAVDLAVGMAVGAAFSAIVKSLVDDIIMPPVGLLVGDMDFSNSFIVLKAGNHGETVFTTIQAAAKAGATTLNYGRFISNIVSFIIIALVFFLFVKGFNAIKEEAFEATETGPDKKKCPECLSDIPFLASRCPFCTSILTPSDLDEIENEFSEDELEKNKAEFLKEQSILNKG